MKNHLDYAEEDPEQFAKFGNDVTAHPWDGLEAARACLQFTPYAVWKIVQKVEDAGRDALADNLLAMIDGDESGKSICREVERTYNEEIQRIYKENQRVYIVKEKRLG
jgi:hypothetical protein